MEEETKQNRVIREVLEFLSNNISVDYEIIGHPDEIERNSPACDAIAIVGSRNVAVEHTSIDSIPSQRKDDNRFKKVLGPLEKELSGKLPAPGHYDLVIHMNVIPTGIKWDDIRQRICNWCQEVAPSLQIGDPFVAPKHFVRGVIQGVPFEVKLYHWPGRDGQFKIGRFSPEDLETQRAKVIHQALFSRGIKVANYRNNGYRTILIFESHDIALANASVIGQAFVNVINEFESAQLPDEVHLVETETEPYYIHCLKYEDTLFPNVIISKVPYLK